MQPVVSVDALVLRTALQDVSLRAGMTLGGRVAERHPDGQHGLLVLAGVPLVASLPEGVPEGEALRFKVLDASGTTLQLQLQPAAAAVVAQPPAPVQPHVLPLGDGRAASVAGLGDGSVALRFDSPALGRLDLRIDRHACTVHVAAGAADVVRAGSDELRLGLAAALGRPVQVTVHPRVEAALDVRA